MPILIKRPNGEATPLINGEYLSAYYFFPKELLLKCGHELSSISRVPSQAIYEKQSREVIESDLFLLLMIDGFSHLTWPYMGIKGQKEIYSGYDPVWQLSHSPSFWVQELVDKKIIPDPVTMVRLWRDDNVSYMSWQEVSNIMSQIVPEVMEKHNMFGVVDTVKKFRCFEDFDTRDSNPKRDFYRKWYHTRTRHPIVSMEEIQTNAADEFISYDVYDPSQDFEDEVCGEMLIDQFKSKISEKDFEILTMRMNGKTYEEIAEKLGYKNHSGIIKRIKRIAEAYLDFYDENKIDY